MMLRFQLNLISCILLFKLCSATLPTLGERCTRIDDGKQGACKLLTECPVVQEAFQTDDILPQACTPFNVEVVVCCVGAASKKEPKSLTKCKDYSTNLTCDMDTLSETALIGNHLKSIKDFAHIASIQYNTAEDKSLRKVFHDQGLLLSSRYVVTAAASVDKDDGWLPARVLLGLLDQQIWVDDETAEYNIAKIIIHPDYHSPTIYNDIALIKLDRQVTFSKFIRPICLPHTEDSAKPTVVYRINYEIEDKRSVVKYQRRLVPNSICNATYEEYFAPNGVDDNFICTTTRELADSKYDTRVDGAPITIEHPNVACSRILLGISVVNMKNGIADAAINVNKYREWIEGIIWSDDEDN